MSKERTLVLIKPDVFAAGKSLAIEAIYLSAGLTINEIRTYNPPPRELVEAHYSEHEGREYYDRLIAFMISGRVQAMIVSGDNAISRVRKLNGATDPAKAEEETIRKRYGTNATHNAVHGSDSPDSAEREIGIWFPHLRPKKGD